MVGGSYRNDLEDGSFGMCCCAAEWRDIEFVHEKDVVGCAIMRDPHGGISLGTCDDSVCSLDTGTMMSHSNFTPEVCSSYCHDMVDPSLADVTSGDEWGPCTSRDEVLKSGTLTASDGAPNYAGVDSCHPNCHGIHG